MGQRGPDVLDGHSTGVVLATVQPTFLYELVWNLLVAAFLVIVDRRFRIGHGRLFALYVAGYCLGRFFIELMRDDHATLILGVRINVFTAAIVFAGALAYFFLAAKGREETVLTGAPEVAAPGEPDEAAAPLDEAPSDAETGAEEPDATEEEADVRQMDTRGLAGESTERNAGD
ncbi:hypothetical protein MTP03_27900 [Tsukamurella sp. PLM1]|nr:hypothetical protein MTP03_27900 [Tsukamurella sp. PLM1]